MAAAKGNDYAVGNEGGRPPKWHDDVVKAMCSKLIGWAEKDDSYIFPQFCVQEKITMRQFYYLKEAYEEFSEAFSYAKALLACRIMQQTGKNKEIHPSLSLRYIKYYDEFLYQFDKQDKAITNHMVGGGTFVAEDYSNAELVEPYASMYNKNLTKRNRPSQA